MQINSITIELDGGRRVVLERGQGRRYRLVTEEGGKEVVYPKEVEFIKAVQDLALGKYYEHFSKSSKQTG
jgi:hypothetical protein